MINQVKHAVDVLKKGGVILYPTDTIWGIGCDAQNIQSIERIRRIKHRSVRSNFILLVSDVEMLLHYTGFLSQPVQNEILAFELPTTVVYPNASNLPPEVLAEDGSIAIRIVKNEFCIEVLNMFGKPIVSTSANISGDPPPATFSEISYKIIHKMDYVVESVLESGNTSSPSRIFRLLDTGQFEIIRK